MDLAFNKIPSGQTADMINFINEIKDKLEKAKQSGKKIIITWHSLGGTLSQIVVKSFPNLFDECYTFNSPSAKDLSYNRVHKDNNKYYVIEIVKTNLNQDILLRPYIDDAIGEAMYNYKNSPMTTKIIDIVSKDDVRFINNLHWKDRFGELIEISGEDHGINEMRKILGFYKFALNNGANVDEITNYLSKMYKMTNKNVLEIAKEAKNGFENADFSSLKDYLNHNLSHKLCEQTNQTKYLDNHATKWA